MAGDLSPSAALAVPTPTEIGLVQFNLTGQLVFHRFQFGHMEDGRTQLLIDPTDDLGVNGEIMRQAVGRDSLIEPLNDCDLTPQFGEALLLTALPTLYIPTSCPVDLERSTKHALLAPQQVGRAPEYPVLSCNHKASSLPYGYETP